MGKIVYSGNIDGKFAGFDDCAVFKTEDGTYWRQVNFRYWDHSAYSPKVVIEDVDGKLMMTVAGETEEVERLTGVEESSIDGEFDGWNGKRRYKLANGETWEEIGYRYKYARADSPDVFIVRVGEATRMYASGIHARVEPVNESEEQ